MTKRLVDIDDELLEKAQSELGTTGITDTVRRALEHVSAISARARHVEWLLSGGMEEMADPEVRDRAWR